MSYLERHWPLKENPNQLLPGVRSAIMLIKSYKNTHGRELPQKNKIARYAVGKDYHLVIAKKLKQLEAFVHEKHLGVKTFIGVDSRPIAERSLALKAGLGFLGKNTMVIKPGLGSYFFIGGMLTTLSLEEDTPLNVNCGTCRLCIDSCPTQALNEDYTMNATQCISYMTIEQKKALDLKGLEQTKDWLYGCDICQEACPYNHGHAPLTDWQDFHPEQGVGFDFFKEREDSDELGPISKKTPLYRSRKLVKQHWSILKNK
jgi:epoxyqueuosine reductase